MKIINTKTYSGQRFIPEDKDYERVERYKSAEDMMNEILKIKDLDKLCRRCIACIMGTGFGRNIHVWVERAKQLGADDTVINDLKDAIIDAFTETTDSDITIQAAQLAAKVADKNKAVENTPSQAEQPKGQFRPDGIHHYTLDRWLDENINSYENTGKVYINFSKEGNVLRPVTYCGQGKSGKQFTVACVAHAPSKTIGDLKEELHKGYKGLVVIGLINSAGRELALSDALNMYFLDGNLILSNNESQIPSLADAEIATLEEKPVQLDTIRRDHVSPDMSPFSYMVSKSPLKLRYLNLPTQELNPSDLKQYIEACNQLHTPVTSSDWNDLAKSFPRLSHVFRLSPTYSDIVSYQQRLVRDKVNILVENSADFGSPDSFKLRLESSLGEIFANPTTQNLNKFCKEFAIVSYSDYADAISSKIATALNIQPVYEGTTFNFDYCIGFNAEGGIALYRGITLGYIPDDIPIRVEERNSPSTGKLYYDVVKAGKSYDQELALIPSDKDFYSEYNKDLLDKNFKSNGIASKAPEKKPTTVETSKPEVKPETESKVITDIIKSGSVRIEPSTFSKIEIGPKTLRKYIDAVIQVSKSRPSARSGPGFRQAMPKEYSDLVSAHKLSNVLFLCPDDPYLIRYQSSLNRAEIYILVENHAEFNGSSAFGRELPDRINELFREMYNEEAPSDETIKDFCQDFCLVKYEDYANSISDAILKQLGDSAQQVYEGCDDIDQYVIGFDLDGRTALVGTSLGWIPRSLNYTEAKINFGSGLHLPELERDVRGLFSNEPVEANITFRDDVFYNRYKKRFMDMNFRLD